MLLFLPLTFDTLRLHAYDLRACSLNGGANPGGLINDGLSWICYLRCSFTLDCFRFQQREQPLNCSVSKLKVPASLF